MAHLENTAPAHPPVVDLEIWSDIACPWCYIGIRKFDDALARYPHRDRVRVTLRSYQLSPDTPAGLRMPEIDALVRSKGMPADQVRRMFDHVAAAAREVGLDIDFDTVVAANTFDAHRLVHLATDAGGPETGEAVLDALFDAHFVGGEVVDDRDALVAIAERAGLDGPAVRAQLDGDAGTDAVRADLAAAAELGVTGVPFFVADRRLALSGAQPPEVFTQLLTRAHADAADRAPIEVSGDSACGPDGCAL